MRTDLTRACLTCGLRLPESESACPRCLGKTLATADPRVSGKRGFWRRLLGIGVMHPVRDLVLYVPALLGGVVTIIGAIAGESWPVRKSGFDGGMLIVGAVAGFDGAALAVALLWFVWAACVLGASLFWNVGTRAPRLRPLPVPSELRAGILARLPQPEPLRIGRRGEPTSGERYLFAIPLLWAFELVFEALGHFASFRGESLGGSLVLLLTGLIFPSFALTLALLPASWAIYALGLALKRVASAIVLLRDRTPFALGERTEALEIGRDHVSGVAHAEAEQATVAPLSGVSCLGFRIQGRIGDQIVDDASLTPFVVSSSDGPVGVRARSYLVALPLGADETQKLDSAQRERLTRFFSDRGLQVDLDDVELRESLLRSGDRVDAYGALTTEIAESDYRSRAERKLLADGDEKPVVVTPQS